ncbi:hypothetical protein ACKI1Q_40880 [Streptomyces galilaeus]|uniref:hypothetical protein n=1 Tax=Streptomyces galilaeus TaxID=33899 RepID=UPI0038F7D529
MWEAPLPEQPPKGPADDHSDRDRAIHALAEALTGLAYKPAAGERPDIRINIGPVGLHGLDVAHCHSIDVTTAGTHKLACRFSTFLSGRMLMSWAFVAVLHRSVRAFFSSACPVLRRDRAMMAISEIARTARHSPGTWSTAPLLACAIGHQRRTGR